MSQSYCIKCGAQQEINSQFCRTCGIEFPKKGREDTAPVQPRVVQERHSLLDVSFFGVYFEGRTYLNLLYLILLFPLGIFYFVYSVTCFSTFAGLIPIVVGILLLYFFLISLPYLMNAQSWLTKVLVGVNSPTQKIHFPKEGTTTEKAIASLKNKSIYKSLLYFLLLAMPFGIITFTVAVTLISTSLGLMFSWAGLIVEYILEGQLLTEVWYSVLPKGFWIAVYVITPFIGFFMLTVSLHILNRMAIYHGKLVSKI